MSYEPPTPSAVFSTEVVNTLNGYPPDQLQHVARYAEELAERKARETSLKEESDEDESDERPDKIRQRARSFTMVAGSSAGSAIVRIMLTRMRQ